MPTRRSDGQIDDYPSWNRILKESTRLYGGGWWFPSLTSRALAPGREVLEVGHMSPGLRPYSTVAEARGAVATVWEYLREFYLDLDDLVETKGFFIHRAPNNDEWRFAIAPRLPIVVPGVSGLFHVSAAADVTGVCHDIDANAAMQVVDLILPAAAIEVLTREEARRTRGNAVLSDKKVLVTGATGQITRPFAERLARDNEVWSAARFTDPPLREEVERLGIRTVQWDLAAHDNPNLPTDFTHVMHCAALMLTDDHEAAIRVNAEGADS